MPEPTKRALEVNVIQDCECRELPHRCRKRKVVAGFSDVTKPDITWPMSKYVRAVFFVIPWSCRKPDFRLPIIWLRPKACGTTEVICNVTMLQFAFHPGVRSIFPIRETGACIVCLTASSLRCP